MPMEVLSLCLDELDAPDLGRLACVSRALRDALSTPTSWNRQASKSLCTDEYGQLPGNMSRAVIAQQHIRDRMKRKGTAARTPSKPESEKKQRPCWQDDWSLPICLFLNEP
ncbi:hypothetical protein KFE25_000811 [Diacronema lutheri]|uniref:F-box domain-containing protein n=1 Tax=Diacronema lutheri TaxID=2081491 RepID=A0A8J6CF07_DIALT|nr:hypothetical protein KFE25_000811 [Diacronema lutheri]